ncbi:MAG TPA: O-antigen ligase family protein [Sedimentisphaerales bacterium]|nr:O-antigen ligase family protein [Sedimentisphaerales bacterium]
MRRRQNKSDAAKSTAAVIFEYILLGLCLAALALRTTFTESPAIQSIGAAESLYEAVYSLSISAVLIFSFILWLVWDFCRTRFSYRLTGIEIGLCFFLVAGVVAGLVAPDKRLAISSFAICLAPILMSLLLVQLLDSRAKVALVLAVIAALGVVNAQRSAEQVLGSNQATIAEYERSPQAHLELRGIEPNSLNAFLFEHRVYSGGASGFFLTRNSAGSFALLASFAAAALLIDQLRNRKAGPGALHILGCGIAAAVIVFSLIITKSKGAFIGLFFATPLFITYVCFEKWLKAHRRALFICCLLLAVPAILAVAVYGLNHGRLPGGSSMLVRWQYWRASVEMYADHALTGVGPGGFSDYYTQYKPASALEAVSDPHNFPLSILTQYGPVGLLGFLAMLLLPLWKVLSGQSTETSGDVHASSGSFGKPAVAFALIISAAMLIVRPIMLPLPAEASSEEKEAGILILYLMPVLVFLIGLLLVHPWRIGQSRRHALSEPAEKEHRSVIAAALFAGSVGLLIHNLTDFAIFEPGVFTTFWTMLACLIATSLRDNENADCRTVRLRSKPIIRSARCGSVAVGFAAIFGYINYALIPVVRSTGKIHQADLAALLGRFDLVHDLLDSAANDDPLNPAALALDARLHIRSYELSQKQNPELLLMAEKSLKAAISRNSVEFKNFERLTTVYIMLAETDTPSGGASWLDKAFDAASEAVKRYPGNAGLRVELARIAEGQGRTQTAIEHYSKAVDIEDSYRDQFRTIYPEREDVVSRLGEDKYLFAKDRLKSLRQHESP